MKNKMKNKNFILFLAFLTALIAILIAYIGLITPFGFESGVITYQADKTPPAPVLSVSEHICKASNGENCNVLYNLCKAESGKFDTSKNKKCQQYAVGKNSNGTFDYSWYQINDVHIIGRSASKGRGKVTLDCVYDLYCITRWVNSEIKAGRGSQWVAWHNI